MLPIPARLTYVILVGSSVMLVIAIVQLSATVMVIAGGWFLMLCFSLMMTVPLGSRLRRERLEFAWWVAHKNIYTSIATVIPKTPFEIKCYLRWWGSYPLRLTSLYPIIPDGIQLLEDIQSCDLELLPRTRTEFSFTLVAKAPGRIVFQGMAVTAFGLAGLFRCPLYFPSPVAVKVLPRASIRLNRNIRTVTGQSTERSGQTLTQRCNDGVELKEIRELQPGDPFRMIAWKASARTGRLMVKEVEQEVQETGYIILDISDTMRGGESGNHKLDLAIEIAATEARHAIERGDRIGVITVDGRIVSHLPPKEGPKQMLRIYDTLLAATEVVDKDLTEESDQKLIGLVGKYLKYQNGIDFSSPEGYLKSHIVSYIEKEMGSSRPEETASRIIVDTDPTNARLRRFCQQRGIPLQYRSNTEGDTKSVGLSKALQVAGGNTRMPQSIMVITDFDGVIKLDTVLKTLRLLRSHGHSIVFIFPNAKSFAPTPQSDLARDLQHVYNMYEKRRCQEARSSLGKLGIPLVEFSQSDTPNWVVAQVHSVRRFS